MAHGSKMIEDDWEMAKMTNSDKMIEDMDCFLLVNLKNAEKKSVMGNLSSITVKLKHE